MYANAPHASATPPTTSTALHATPPGTVTTGQPGMPPAHPGGPHGMTHAAPLAPAPTRARSSAAAAFVTGAYAASGDPAIDRMIRLEAACKRFGSPL